MTKFECSRKVVRSLGGLRSFRGDVLCVCEYEKERPEGNFYEPGVRKLKLK